MDIFRGLRIESDKDIGPKGTFCRGLEKVGVRHAAPLCCRSEAEFIACLFFAELNQVILSEINQAHLFKTIRRYCIFNLLG